MKPKKKEMKELIPPLTKLLFIRIVREENNKELREAVDKTKRIWAENSIEYLESVAKEVGKDMGISYQKILNRIITRDILVEHITTLLDNCLPELEVSKVDILNGDFNYELHSYESHPSIKAPLSN